MASDQARSPELLLTVARGAAPLQAQVEEGLRAAIRSGRLGAGERLPSSRALASDLGVSRGVASGAYEQLAAEGWLDVRPRSAPRVAASPSTIAAPPAAARSPTAAAAPLAAYDLRPGRPDLAAFPRRAWARALADVLRDAPDTALDYPPPEGATELRRVLAAYRGRVRGVLCAPEDVLVTAGAGQALMAIVDALLARCAPRQPLMVLEDPGHADVHALLAQRGVATIGVPVDGDGLVTDALPPRADAVLVTPAHQFPRGVVLAPERRAALLAWAERCGAVVIEDDYDSEYRYDRAPVGALQGLRPDLVLHTGTTSKTLAPALRLGWLVAPPAWHADLARAKGALDHGLPTLEQLALARFIERGEHDRHLRRMARRYRERRDALVAALAVELPDGVVAGAAAGLHLALTVPGDPGAEPALAAACRERGVLVDHLARHATAAPPAPTLILSFARVPPPAAPHVARLIAAARAAAGTLAA